MQFIKPRKKSSEPERERRPKSKPVRVELQIPPEEWAAKIQEARRVRSAQSIHGERE